MEVLFVSKSRPSFGIIPFIKSQEDSLKNFDTKTDHFLVNHPGLFGYLKSIPRLRAKILKGNFDVIHAHYGYCGWVALLTFTGLPIVVSLMGSDVYGGVSSEGKRGLKSYIEITATKLLQLFVDRIIVKSRNLYNDLFVRKKATIIPNGVDFEKFKPMDKFQARAKLNLTQEAILILFLGHATYTRKNFPLLREAVRLVNNPRWEIISPYPTDPKNVPHFINAADVLVLTSFREGSPNVIKEAMACNRPIVSTDVGDVREIIEHTDGCYLSSYDTKELANNLKRAIQFGKPTTGRKDIEHLEISRVAAKIVSVYEKVLLKSSGWKSAK